MIITFTKTFESELFSLPVDIRQNIFRKLQAIHTTSGYTSHLKKLASVVNTLSARVGDYRIIFSQTGGQLKALCVRHRREVYRTLGKRIDPNRETVEDPFDQESVCQIVKGYPFTQELLQFWEIPSDDQRVLIGCDSDDALVNLGDSGQISYDMFSRIVELLYPADLCRLEQAPAYQLPPTDSIELLHEQDMLSFLLHLDDHQRRLAEINLATQADAQSANGPILVKGGPGSGKSTVALYRIRKILEHHSGALFQQTPTILFLTYTKALTKCNQDALKALLGEQAKEVTVSTLDSCAYKIVNAKKPVGTLLDETAVPTLDLFKSIRTALSPAVLARFSDQYLIEELFLLERLQIKNRQDYLAANRRGRKAPLNEDARKAVWALYEAFLERMLERGMQTWDGLRTEAYGIVTKGEHPEKYDYVIVDEAQDLTPYGIKLAVELCKHPGGLYFTADVNQKLYQNGFSWQNLHESLRFNRHNSYTLTKNYRNTKEIAEAAKSFLTNIARDEDDAETLQFHGGASGDKPAVIYTRQDTEIAQLKHLIKELQHDLKLPLAKIAILVAGDTAQAYRRGIDIAQALKDSGVKANYMASKDLRIDARCVKVMSLYTSKGLEFPAVIIVDVNDGILPRMLPHLPPEERKQEAARDHRLLFVGMTRAMQRLVLVAREDAPSPILFELDPHLWRLPYGVA